MKYLKQFGIILAISFAGEILNTVIPLPVPASIYGIVILFMLLTSGLLKLESVKGAADYLIAIMPVMFIPAAAGLIDSWSIIKPSVVQYIAVTVISTVVVMAVSGIVTEFVIKIRQGKGENKNDKLS